MQKAVFWDLDGTLVDPADAITGGMADAIEAHGFTRPDEATMRKFVGPPSLYCLENFTDVPQEKHLEVMATYREGYRAFGIAKSRVYPGIVEVLQALKDAHVLLALATQKNLSMAERVLEYFDLTSYFDAVVGSPDELGSGDQSLPKDKPGIIARGLADLGLVPGENAKAVMIGDRVYDADGAKANGLPSVGVEWGYGTETELSEDFDYRAQDSQQLQQIIAEILEVSL